MKIKHRHFPYPVLSPYSNDIVGRPLEATIELEIVDRNLRFTANFDLENKTLRDLIASNQAVYGVHIECSSTMKRLFKKSQTAKFIFDIEQKFLNNQVNINFFVIAERDIVGYKNNDFHDDFEGVTFNVKKGDQLAFTETVKMNIEKEPIAKTNSIFELAVNPDPNAPLFAADFEDKILVSVPQITFDEINELRGYMGSQVDSLLVTMYYTPALVEGLYYIRDSMKDDTIHLIEEKLWYRSIERRLDQLKINISSLTDDVNIPDLANKILDDANARALKTIKLIYGIEEEGEDA